MTPTPIDIILTELSDIKSTLNEHTRQLARVETLIDERTSKAIKRRALLSKSAWTTVISGLAAAVWEWFRAKH